MMASLYGVLVRLHPPEFRERFAPEMTLNFEEAGRPVELLFDCVVSVGRQWLARAGWKLVPAVAIAYLQVVALSGWWHLGRLPTSFVRGGPELNEPQGLELMILCAAAFVVVLALLTALWVRGLVAARWKAAGRGRKIAL